tara:strand:- start:61 stop:1020 length:960 start_codon:yes stop_codon:yes gene_type:complete
VRSSLALVLLLCAGSAFAHEVRPAFLQIEELDGEITYRASFRQPQIGGRYLGLSLETNCEQTSLSAGLNEGALTENFDLECTDAPLSVIEIVGLERTLIDTLVNITRLDGSEANFLISGDEPVLDIGAATPTLPVYLAIGIEHLLLGFDHILFVLMLLYLVRKPLDIIKVVTSFTVAHSITLALAAFDVVQLSQPPVEAVIAGSIVLLAYENLQKQRSLSRNFPVLIAFGFGLLHGLGFAGALAEIGLPESSQLLALFLFNVGIELGQLVIIVVVLLLLASMRFKFNRIFYEAPIYLTGGIASFWFIQRAWLILLPVVS